jgi:hypothetical protein
MISAIKSFCRCFKLQVRNQYWRSHYARERMLVKLVRVFWCFVYLCYAVGVGITFLCREVLGEHVIYRGQRCWVVNWANSDSPKLGPVVGSKATYDHCSRAEIHTIHSPTTYIWRFISGFNWYMTSWYSIDVDRRLCSPDDCYTSNLPGSRIVTISGGNQDSSIN